MELKDRLESKAKAGVSNISLITPEILDAALLEAEDLIGDKEISDTVRLDIAYFRFALMVKKDGVDETEVKVYDKAMKLLSVAPTISIDGTSSGSVFVETRKNRWQ